MTPSKRKAAVEAGENVAHTTIFPVGSYVISTDEKGRVRVFMREFRMTVRQIVEKFGEVDADGFAIGKNLSSVVKTAWGNNETETFIDVMHTVIPNPDFNPDMLESRFKRYLSVYYEVGTYETGSNQSRAAGFDTEDRERYLRISGFDLFPALGVRWEVTSNGAWGDNCPGMEALPDIKQLQVGEKRSLQAIEKNVNPPLVAPTALKNQPTSILPGGITFSDERGDQKGFRAIHKIAPMISDLEGKQSQVRNRINIAYFADLFRKLLDTTRRQITAREVDEIGAEKLTALGPVLEQLNQDLLDPLIDFFFAILLRQGEIPEPPEELQGLELKVEYISIMAQAQKLTGVATLERFGTDVASAAAVKPDILDKVDLDQWVDELGDQLSIPPGIVVDDETVAAVRAARAQAEQAKAQLEAVGQAAAAASDLGKADLSGDSALRRLTTGAASPQAPQGA